ncbi:hypothetical protein [Natronohydrobacter thiooxidans]|uniref:hypothetical protein n=1 Tax=Natronohydrobacter thiooxidans TaxID=87172 RepID=UPI000AF71E20|nr:hypothetical protein [Natronohydrobacter thiooxidans]
MNSTISLLIVFLTQLFMPRHNAQMRLLKAQIQILSNRIPTQRIILAPEEKAELLRIGAEFGHEIDGLLKWQSPRPTSAGLCRCAVDAPSRPWAGRA